MNSLFFQVSSISLKRPLQIFLAVLFSFQTVDAQAYLDPGTGSMLLSAILGIVFTLFYLLKGFYYKAVSFFFGLFGLSFKQKSKYGFVFYSEGRQYWNTFRPAIESLDKLNVKLTYLTSDEQDEGLNYQSANVTSRFIGTDNKAFTYLNRLEADVCVMTTPGLDVMQIRRSKGVKHYAHIIHAPTDAGIYKLFSFDYYDSVLCSGDHQIKSIRVLEDLRKTNAKLLLKSGCPYMDVLGDKLENTAIISTSRKKNRILIAPSWGINGSLQRFGVKLIKPLLDAGFQVLVRPHPQSYLVESDGINGIKRELEDYSNLAWDSNADGFNALNNTDIMISDLSGVIFDYAFIFEKPVISITFEMDLLGTEANDLPYKVWEQGMLDRVGKSINADEISSLPKLVAELLLDQNLGKNLKTLRDQHVYNYRNSGQIAANQLIEIQASVLV